jgi:hypothetical protein
MKTWSFFHPETGLFSGRVLRASDRAIAENTPDGLIAIEGEYDYLCQRVENGQVVDYQPPQPDADHEWNGQRWVLKREVEERNLRRYESLHQIRLLEERQLRPLRELSVNPDNSEARQRLTQIEKEIAELRADVTG